MRYLVTGACGLLGSNLSGEVIARGAELVAFDNLSRHGSTSNLEWLRGRGKFQFVHGDIRNTNDVEQVISEYRPQVIFHLAGQVAMTTSIKNPRLDFETNAVGTFNVLEAVRRFAPECAILYSSTNKVYGDLNQFAYEERAKRYVCAAQPEGFDESVSLDFSSPYGCSKGSADQYMLDYHRIHGLRTVVFRHSSIFGVRQFATFDQGWVGWFVEQALRTKQDARHEFTISGTGKQVRDVLFVNDLINCYFQAASRALEGVGVVGQAFNIGGGISNSLSLLELFDFLENEIKVKMNYKQLPWRQSDQKVFVANYSKAERCFSWKPSIKKEQGLREMIEWTASHRMS